MVNFGFDFVQYSGLIYIILGILYIIALRMRWKSVFRQFLNPTYYNIQSLFIPIILIIIGLILFFQGWRVDPILQLAFFLKAILLSYIFGKDFILFKLANQQENNND